MCKGAGTGAGMNCLKNFWCAGTIAVPPKKLQDLVLKNETPVCGFRSIPGVAPRIAPRIGFRTRLVVRCTSETCSENPRIFKLWFEIVG